MNDLEIGSNVDRISNVERLIGSINSLIDTVNRLKKGECRKVIQDFNRPIEPRPHSADDNSDTLDLSADEIMTLRTIRALHSGVTLKRVVERLAEIKDEPVHSSSISLIMTRFKKQKFLQEKENKNDGRQNFNILTEKGETLAQRLEDAEETVLKNVIDALHLDEELAADLNQRVDRAHDRIKDQSQSKPSIAGVYDYVLGGSSNTAFDRKWVDVVAKIDPGLREAAKANRAFLQRAVHYLAAERGISQFLDIGSGFPTNGNTHELALQINQHSHITYVDNDPEVVRASRNLLHETANVRVAQQDLRYIERWLTADRFHNIDLTKPVAVLLVAVLHFIKDDSEVRDILAFLKEKLVPGSYLVISHGTSSVKNEEVMKKLVANYSRQVSSAALRPRDVIVTLLKGFELVEPKLVFISKWKPNLPGMVAAQHIAPEDLPLLACVAKI